MSPISEAKTRRKSSRENRRSILRWLVLGEVEAVGVEEADHHRLRVARDQPHGDAARDRAGAPGTG